MMPTRDQWAAGALVGGAALAAGYAIYKGLQTKLPKCILTVRPGEVAGSLAYVEKDWVEYLGNFYGVSCKICDGRSMFTKKPGPLLDGATAAGIQRLGWGFHYCKTPKRAREEAEEVARAVERWGVVEYAWNVEGHFFGCWGKEALPVPVAERATIFAQRFRELLPGVKLVYNGLSYKSYYYDSDGKRRTGIGAAMTADNFDRYTPMMYHRGRDTVEDRQYWARLLPKSAKKFPNVPEWGPMTGTGRQKMVGDYLEAYGWFCPKNEQPGLDELAGIFRADAWSFFYGYGSKPMLSKGWAYPNGDVGNPPLATVAKRMHDAYRRSDPGVVASVLGPVEVAA